MEGRGLTNYSTEKPSYAYSTQTTEFDDALVERGIVTLEQAFQAKGASAKEAQRLANLKRSEQNSHEVEVDFTGKKEETGASADEDGSSFDDSDDDEFLAQYRQQRLQELKKPKGPYGEVIPISRPDWTREVNEDSHKAWVVVTLTSNDVERTGCVEAAVQSLSQKFPTVKFVTIPSSAAIADWPNENLPTIFLYRNGKLQKEFIRLKRNITADELEWELAESGVLESDLDERPSTGRGEGGSRVSSYGGSSVFGGSMTQLETRRHESDSDEYEDSDC